jgi:hypothetical protein
VENAPPIAPGARRTALAAVIAAFVLMQGALVLAVKHDTLEMDVGPNTRPTPDFHGTVDLGQTFTANSPNIARIDLLFGTHGRTPSYRIDFELSETGPGGRVVAASHIEASGLRNNLFNTFRFPAVRATRGKAYLIRLAAPSATAETAVALWMNDGDVLPAGTMMYNGAPAAGDLCFRVYSRRTVLSAFGRIVRGNPGIFGSPVFFAAVVLFFEAAFVWALVAITGRVFERRSRDV